MNPLMNRVNANWKTIALETISFLFIILFAYAAVTKLLDYQKFAVQIGQSPLLNDFAGWIAWVIPTIEIVIAAMLATPRLRLIAMHAAFSLMVMFTTYIIVILNFSSNIPCSCGGVLEKLGWTEHLIFNVAFILLGLAGIILTSDNSFKSSSSSGNPAMT